MIEKGNTMIFYSNSPRQTEEVGEKLAKILKPGAVIAYKGDLGAGKSELASSF